MKYSCETLQNLPYFWNTKTHDDVHTLYLDCKYNVHTNRVKKCDFINFVTPISDKKKNVVFAVNCQGSFCFGEEQLVYSFWALFLLISLLKTETSSRDDAAKTFFRAAAPPPWQSPFWLLLSHFCRNIVQLSSRGWLDYGMPGKVLLNTQWAFFCGTWKELVIKIIGDILDFGPNHLRLWRKISVKI